LFTHHFIKTLYFKSFDKDTDLLQNINYFKISGKNSPKL